MTSEPPGNPGPVAPGGLDGPGFGSGAGLARNERTAKSVKSVKSERTAKTGKSGRILVAEADPASRLALTKLLWRWGYEVTAVADGDEAWRVLTSGDSPRLVFLDWDLPGRGGPAICAELRRSEKPDHFHVVLMAPLDRRSDLAEGAEAEADDYVFRPLEREELRVRLRAGQRILDLEAELAASREAFREHAINDPLTGVLSRRALLVVLKRELARAKRNKTPLSVALADVDHFKLVRGKHGEKIADSLLLEVARRVSSCVRESDAVGRVGGEEFLMVLPGADVTGAALVAERLRARVAATPVQTPAGELHVTMSVGVAATQGDVVTASVLVASADRALHLARKQARERLRASPSSSP